VCDEITNDYTLGNDLDAASDNGGVELAVLPWYHDQTCAIASNLRLGGLTLASASFCCLPQSHDVHDVLFPALNLFITIKLSQGSFH
jgi:hypothetical protein